MWIRASLLALCLTPMLASAESPAPLAASDGAPGGPGSDGPAPVETTLEPCPSSPNCVSSQADEGSDAYVPPLQAGDTLFGAVKRLNMVLEEMERVEWSQKGPFHIHAEFSSSLFGFVDDVDLVAQPDGTVHVRSASRLGYWDMGVNRERVETLRQKLDTLNSQH